MAAVNAIVDRLLQLIAYRHDRKRRILADLLQPLFNELLHIHADYLEMFTELTKRLYVDVGRPNVKALNNAIEYLRIQRIECEPIREKLRASAKTLQQQSLDRDTALFVSEVFAYLFGRPELRPTGSRSAGLLSSLLDAQTKVTLSRKTRQDSGSGLPAESIARVAQDLVQLIDGIVSEQRTQWARVCEAYARLETAVRTQ